MYYLAAREVFSLALIRVNRQCPSATPAVLLTSKFEDHCLRFMSWFTSWHVEFVHEQIIY